MERLGSAAEFFFEKFLPNIDITGELIDEMYRTNNPDSLCLIGIYFGIRKRNFDQELIASAILKAERVKALQKYVNHAQIIGLLPVGVYD